MKKEVFEGAALLFGTVIGAGVLGIPYVLSQSGLGLGLITFFLIFFTVLTVNLQVGEIVLRTQGKHQLSGYAEKYLGKPFKHIMALSMCTYIFGALVAYILGQGLVFSNLFGGDPLYYSTVYFILMVVIVSFDLSKPSLRIASYLNDPMGDCSALVF